MRQTKEQILTQFPSCVNHPSNNIVGVCYGDIPDTIYTQKDYDYWEKLTGTLSNIMYTNAFIYAVNGVYDIYNTLIGKIYIHHDMQQLLHGTISIPYRNKSITTSINQMYGLSGLSLLDLKGTGQIKGFCNKDGNKSPCNHTPPKELDSDVIKEILSNPMSDYGYGAQKFMETARELYDKEPYNYIMEKFYKH